MALDRMLNLVQEVHVHLLMSPGGVVGLPRISSMARLLMKAVI